MSIPCGHVSTIALPKLLSNVETWGETVPFIDNGGHCLAETQIHTSYIKSILYDQVSLEQTQKIMNGMEVRRWCHSQSDLRKVKA